MVTFWTSLHASALKRQLKDTVWIMVCVAVMLHGPLGLKMLYMTELLCCAGWEDPTVLFHYSYHQKHKTAYPYTCFHLHSKWENVCCAEPGDFFFSHPCKLKAIRFILSFAFYDAECTSCALCVIKSNAVFSACSVHLPPPCLTAAFCGGVTSFKPREGSQKWWCKCISISFSFRFVLLKKTFSLLGM